MLLALSSCTGSIAEMHFNPNKVTVEVSGNSYGVVKREGNYADVWVVGIRAISNTIKLKQEQMKAVEIATKCRAIDYSKLSAGYAQVQINCDS